MKKRLQRSIAMLLTILMVCGAAPAGVGILASAVSTYKILPNEVIFTEAGESQTLKVYDESNNLVTSGISWVTPTSSMLHLTNDGIISAVSLPTAEQNDFQETIRAIIYKNGSYDGEATCVVTLKSPQSHGWLEGITINPDVITDMNKVGDTRTLTVSAQYEGLSNPVFVKPGPNLTWGTSDNSYVEVSSSGVVTLKKLPAKYSDPIEIIITATFNDGAAGIKSNTCVITLQPKMERMETLTWSPKPQDLLANKTYDMSEVFGVVISPFDTTIDYKSMKTLQKKVEKKGITAAEMRTYLSSALADQGKDFKALNGVGVLNLPDATLEEVAAAVLTNLKTKGVDVTASDMAKTGRVVVYWILRTYCLSSLVTLTCVPESAVTVYDLEQKIAVHSIATETLTITLKLAPNDTASQCQPITAQLVVHKNVKLDSVRWLYNYSPTSGMALFNFFESGVTPKIHSQYYYAPYEDDEYDYMYETSPAWARPFCTFEFYSSDERVMKFEEVTHRLLVVGNGQTELTVTAKAKTAGGVVITKSATFIGVVQDSPYTPINNFSIKYDPNNVGSTVEYDSSSNTLTIMYPQKIGLLPSLEPTAASLTPDMKYSVMDLINGETVRLYQAPKLFWTSDNEDVATVDEDGVVKIEGSGKAVVQLRIIDNGKEIKKSLNVKGTMSTWEALLGILMSFFTGRWGKIPNFARAFFDGFGQSAANFGKGLWEVLVAVIKNIGSAIGSGTEG